MKDYAQNMEQISLYEADLTYGDCSRGKMLNYGGLTKISRI